MRRTLSMTLAGVAALLGALALAAAPAGAAVGYIGVCPTLETLLCTLGGPEAGNFFGEAVAVDNSSGPSAGDVWLGKGRFEEGEKELVKFDASGNELVEVGESNVPGSAQQIFARKSVESGLAVDPASGDVYISTYRYENEKPQPGTVTKFDSSGVFQFQLTGSETPQHAFTPGSVAVGAGGDLYVADVEHGLIDKFTSSGEYIEQFPVPFDRRYVAGKFALGPEGNVYLPEKERVSEYGPTGAPVDCPGGSNILHVEGGGKFNEPGNETVAVDPVNGHIFAGAGNEAEGEFIAEYSSLCAPVPSAKVGAHEFGSTQGWGEGIGINGSTHAVYVNPWQVDFALIFNQVTLPDTATGAPATGITRTTAAVSGTVNPAGTEVTTCAFEYGTTAGYGHSEPCVQALPLAGSSSIPVSAVLHFSLPPASVVHYRLRSGTANGSTFGEDHTFSSEALPPPVVGGLPATGVAQFGATLNGTLKTGEALVNYRFEYGPTTAYGSVEPIPDGVTPITNETVPLSQPVQGLQAGTTYHYRLVASSPGATEVKGPDETFTTLSVPAPTVGTGGASGVGVGSATLSGSVDPHDWDTTYLFQYGTSTAYGSSWPSVQVDLGALEGPQPVVVGIPNLLPNTTYHYRLVATNGGGTSYGQDMTFTTGEYPPQIIQEPVALKTLLVPSGKGILPAGKSKKGKQHKKSKARSKHRKKSKKGKKSRKGKKK